MKTYNRGRLLKLVKAGKVEMIRSSGYDDMHGGHDRKTPEGIPVQLMPEDRSTRKQGIAYLFESDFKTKSGMAYERGDVPGVVVLIVHSNCDYELRIKE